MLKSDECNECARRTKVGLEPTRKKIRCSPGEVAAVKMKATGSKMARSTSLVIESRQNSGISSPPFQSLRITADRRRSSASEITMSAAAARASSPNGRSLERPSLLRKGFVYSRAWLARKKKNKQRAESHAEEASSVDESIVINRDLTRRTRNSFRETKYGSDKSLNATNVTAYLSARAEAEKPVVADVYDHSSAIVKALSKGHMHDICLVGYDGIAVGASKFILGCYSSVYEEMFFNRGKSSFYDEKKQKVTVDFCNSDVIRAAVHHCCSGELPDNFETSDTTEDTARKLARLGCFANTFQMRALAEVSYKAARKLINRRAVLACAVFDELSSLKEAVGFDCIKGYALDTIRDMPMDTLLGGGVQWMKEESLEHIMLDKDLDVVCCKPCFMFIIYSKTDLYSSANYRTSSTCSRY